jgi:hypothetical protein
MYRIVTTPFLPPPQVPDWVTFCKRRTWTGQDRVLRGVLGGQMEVVTGGQGKCVMGSFIVVLFAMAIK